MKKLVSLVLSIMMLLSCAAMADELPTLTMGTNAAFPPYEFIGDDGNVIGIDVEIAEAVCAEMGYKVVVRDMEFDSIISDVQYDKIDFGMAGMTVTEERMQSVNFSDSYATGIQAIIVKEGSPITCADDLFVEGANYTIGVQLSTTGDLYSTWDIEDAGLGTVMRYATGNEAVQDLALGRVDCVIIDNEPAKSFVAAIPGLKVLETSYAVEDYAACFNKEDTELLANFNAALKKLTDNGTIAAIIEKYIPAEKAE